VSVLFLVRNARDTIASIIDMYARLEHLAREGEIRLSEPPGALEYYSLRLRQIEAYSAQRQSDTLFIEAERLIDDTASVLDGIARWLQLGEPLSSSYHTFELTGVQGHCDTSASIKTGRLVKDSEERHRAYAPTTIPNEILRRGEAAYAQCRDALLRWRLPD